jgi:NitT/TauT family transport system permease protein
MTNWAGKYLMKHRPSFGHWQGRGNGMRMVVLATVGMGLFFLAWAVGGYFLFSRPRFSQFAGFMPRATLKAMSTLLVSPEFWPSVLASLRRIGVGIGSAFVLGLPIGLLIGYFRTLRTISHTPIQFVRMISPLSWMPIALLIFSTFESAIYFLITMATIWPIIMNSSLGVSRVNPQWIKMAKNQGAGDLQVLLHIILPASIPYILTSLRLALGVAWIVLVPVEFLGISSGLGYIINDARDTMEYDRLMAIVLAIGVIGFFLDGGIQLTQKVFRWNWVNTG